MSGDTVEHFAHSIPALIFASVILVIFFVHSYKFYQDFYTKDRLSVSHRRAAPDHRDRIYIRGSRLTLLTLFFYTFTLVSYAIQYSFVSSGCTWITLIPSTFGVFASKAGLYLTYVFRLHQIYAPTAYGYSYRKLSCIATFVVIFCIAMVIALVAVTASYPIAQPDDNGKFPHFCQIAFQEPYQAMLGGIMVLFEVICSALAIWGFIRPLKKVVTAVERTMSVKNVHDATSIEAKKRNEKILYSGYKYKVLVIFASASTFVWIFLFIIRLNAIGIVFLLLDYVVNPICILMMTAYYPSDQYYERLCYLCVCCCDPRKKSYRSQASASRVSVTGAGAKSVDTSRAVHHAPSAPNADEAQSDVQLAVNLNTVDANEVTPEPQADEAQNEDASA